MPKRIPPLTAKGLDAVRPRDDEVIELGDGHLPGLRVRISGGGRFWSLNTGARCQTTMSWLSSRRPAPLTVRTPM